MSTVRGQGHLVVRRVKRHQVLASDGTEQGELFATYRHHAFITNSTLELVEADQRHRDHAIIEQVIAELKDGPLAHLPSGKYAANAAWLAHAVIAFNIARTAAVAAGQPKTRWGHAAHPHHQHASPDRIDRATTRAAPAPPVAMGTGMARAMDSRDRATNPGHHLTTQPSRAQPENPKWKNRPKTGRTRTSRTPDPSRVEEISEPNSQSVDQG